MVEHKIGEIFDVHIKVKAVEHPYMGSCDGCVLYDFNCCDKLAGSCSNRDRSDHTNVIFVEVEED